MNVIGYRFDELVVTEEFELVNEKNVKVYYLNFPLQEKPAPCPKGTKPSKLIDLTSKPNFLIFMGIEFPFLGYESPVDDRRIYKVRHPDHKDMVLRFTITNPGRILKYVHVDYK